MKYDVIVIGAGAAGLMCAWQAGQRGKKVAIIEHTHKIAEKIRISGGGRCNFTNLYSSPENFISQNPHFCKSALARFTPHDFLALVAKANIKWHEKPYEEKPGNENARGQLFCDSASTQIIDMLLEGCKAANVTILTGTKVTETQKTTEDFAVTTTKGDFSAQSLVIASGGLSIPKIGATNFGYELAKQYGLPIIPPKAALVPFTFEETELTQTKPLSGISIDARVSNDKATFREGLLFTHRGLSGPSILQISSYWDQGQDITIDLAPDIDVIAHLKTARTSSPKQEPATVLSRLLPQRLAHHRAEAAGISGHIGDLSDAKLQKIADTVKNWKIKPLGTEGYRTAEVTRGGIDTNAISSKTFEARDIKGLHFIGEVLDVTGHLGGHNFQWAWASGYCAGQFV